MLQAVHVMVSNTLFAFPWTRLLVSSLIGWALGMFVCVHYCCVCHFWSGWPFAYWCQTTSCIAVQSRGALRGTDAGIAGKNDHVPDHRHPEEEKRNSSSTWTVLAVVWEAVVTGHHRLVLIQGQVQPLTYTCGNQVMVIYFTGILCLQAVLWGHATSYSVTENATTGLRTA